MRYVNLAIVVAVIAGCALWFLAVFGVIELARVL